MLDTPIPRTVSIVTSLLSGQGHTTRVATYYLYARVARGALIAQETPA